MITSKQEMVEKAYPAFSRKKYRIEARVPYQSSNEDEMFLRKPKLDKSTLDVLVI